MKARFSFSLVCLGCFALGLHAQPPGLPGLEPEKAFRLGGYVKLLGQGSLPEGGAGFYDGLVHQRFNAEWDAAPTLQLAAGMRNRVLFGDSLDLPGYADLVEFDPGYWTLSWNWLEEGGVLGTTAFDRLYADWSPESWKVRLGRQRVNWGMSTLWNPNDLFNTYSIYDIDYEERPGADALLFRRDLGVASLAEGVWAFGDSWDETTLAGRWRFNRRGYDIQLLGGKNRTDVVGGAGFAGSLGGSGFRGEATYFSPYRDSFSEDIMPPPDDALVATLQADHSFHHPRNPMVSGSLLYISDPRDAGNTLVYVNRPLTARTLSFTPWTGYGDVGFDLSPLSRQTLGAGVYDDGSVYGLVSNSLSLADDWELLLVWQTFTGASDSLFGETPYHLLLARVRWSF